VNIGQLLIAASRGRGGIFEFVCGLSREVARSGGESRVFAIEDEHAAADRARWEPVVPQLARRWGPRRLGFAPGLLPLVLRAKLDLLHAHDLWTLQSLLTQAWAARAARPYVLSIHGMLNAWALGRSRVKKKIATALYEGRRLRRAAALHTLGPHETHFVRAFGLKTPVAEIPYGIDLPDLAQAVPPPPWARDGGPPRVLLYLGRFDSIKGLDHVVRGWARARGAAGAGEWRLVLAGWGDGGYEARLRALAAAECPDGSITFPGPLFGPGREAAFRGAQACVLASLSEGQPVSVLEAMARARPVLVSGPCHLAAAVEAGAALPIAKGDAGVHEALRQLFTTAPATLEEMGQRGRRLMEARFSWPVVGRQFMDLYRWALGGGTPPPCVARP
jgi:glycosyltransferase involved in cell wall biosynthesis